MSHPFFQIYDICHKNNFGYSPFLFISPQKYHIRILNLKSNINDYFPFLFYLLWHEYSIFSLNKGRTETAQTKKKNNLIFIFTCYFFYLNFNAKSLKINLKTSQKPLIITNVTKNYDICHKFFKKKGFTLFKNDSSHSIIIMKFN